MINFILNFITHLLDLGYVSGIEVLDSMVYESFATDGAFFGEHEVFHHWIKI